MLANYQRTDSYSPIRNMQDSNRENINPYEDQ